MMRMKTVLIGVNAKYIHPNLAIRLLKKNTSYPCDIKEFTIKDTTDSVIDFVLRNQYDIVGFSCYIWNIEFIKQVLPVIKPYCKIVLGGPEVSYNAKFYLDNNCCDYVIKNEGEEAFDKLLCYLDGKIAIDKVPNLFYKGGFTFDCLVDISQIKMAYDLLDDVENKIVYFETSRGCPYHCAYCMASLDNKVRFFAIEEIETQLLGLLNRGARIIKFLDRTFNANKKIFLRLIDFIIKNHKPNNSFQFEITGDLLNYEIIDYINEKAPKHLIRFEIGIQSTNLKTNLSVNRIQDNEKLFSNIKRIQRAGVIDLHLDLIAGLPYEDYSSFENTFNEVLALRPKELQLGFLKILHGTKMELDATKYHYVYQKTAPYEIISNDFLSEDDIKKIHIAEDAFESYYNSGIMPNAMKLILDEQSNSFIFFLTLGYQDFKGHGLENTFKVIDNFLKTSNNYQNIHQALIFDYLQYFKVRPKAWWSDECSKEDRKQILRLLDRSNLLPMPLAEAYRYAMVINLESSYIIAAYYQYQKNIKIIKKETVDEALES